MENNKIIVFEKNKEVNLEGQACVEEHFEILKNALIILLAK